VSTTVWYVERPSLDEVRGPKNGITEIDEMRGNLRTSCLPVSLLDGVVPEYDELVERRKLMARKMNHWFQGVWA